MALSRRTQLTGIATVLAVLAAGGAALALYLRDADKRRGLDLARHDRFSEAEPFLQRALARNPDDAEAVGALAVGYRTAGRIDQAGPLLDRWCELRPDQAEPFQRRMELRLQQRQTLQAIEDGAHAFRLEPDNVKLGRQLAPLLFGAGRLEDAERVCRRCLEREPENPALVYLLADVCHARGNNADAEAVLDRYLAARPGNPHILLLRAILFVEADQPQQAIPLLRKLLAAAPPAPHLIAGSYYLSLALQRSGQTEAAAQALADVKWHQALAQLNRSDQLKFSGQILRMAETLLNFGKTSAAVDMLGTVLAQDPASAGETVRLLEKAAATDPKSVVAHELLANYYERRGQTELAAEHRRRARP